MPQASGPASTRSEIVFASTTRNELIRFNAGPPATVLSRVTLTGMQPGDGTGVYLEAYRDRTSYLCLCYGRAEVETRAGAKESLVSRYHETPRVIYADNRPSPMVSGPVVNHSDAELIMLEALMGRRPPQSFLDNVLY